MVVHAEVIHWLGILRVSVEDSGEPLLHTCPPPCLADMPPSDEYADAGLQDYHPTSIDTEHLTIIIISPPPPPPLLMLEWAGAGLSVEHQTKLFKSIIQFNASKLQGGKGSGLGLYISKGSMNLPSSQCNCYYF